MATKGLASMQRTKYTLPGVGMIPLKRHNGTVRAWAIVDLSDFKEAMKYRWHYSSGYVQRNIYQGSKRLYGQSLHRQLMGLSYMDSLQVDHIDINPLNNRRNNLRFASNAENRQNIRPQGFSKFRGVDWHKPSRKWRARVRHEGKLVHLGMFHDELEAARAASEFRKQHMPYAVEPLTLAR